jgi:hypothetical protein
MEDRGGVRPILGGSIRAQIDGLPNIGHRWIPTRTLPVLYRRILSEGIRKPTFSEYTTAIFFFIPAIGIGGFIS